MKYRILGLRKGNYVPIGDAEGIHAQAAIMAFRKQTGIGGKMQAKLAVQRPTDPDRRWFTTSLVACETYDNAKAYTMGNRPLVVGPPTPKPYFLHMSDGALAELRDKLIALHGIKHDPDKGVHPYPLVCSSHLLPEEMAEVLRENGVHDFRRTFNVSKP